VVGQPHRSFSAFLTDVDKRCDYERQRDINVLMNHTFLSSLDIKKMKSLLPPDRPSRKGTNDTRIQDSDPEYNPSDEHESDPETCQQEIILL
jgi:hypothetical protein